MFKRFASVALVCAGFFGFSSVNAQGWGYTPQMYGPYSYGQGMPDFSGVNLGAFVAEQAAMSDAIMKKMLHENQQLSQKIQRDTKNLIEQGMNTPEIQEAYKVYQRNGGTASLRDFTYNYQLTAGFTADGIDRFRKSEAESQRKLANTMKGVREAEARSREAMQEGRDSFFRNHSEVGNNLAGNRTYVDENGENHLVNYLQKGISEDRSTGNKYNVDKNGKVWIRRPNDWFWNEMQPSR